MYVIDEKRRPYFVTEDGRFFPCETTSDTCRVEFDSECEPFEYDCVYTANEVKQLIGKATSILMKRDAISTGRTRTKKK